jgi:hypothetical protein
MSTSHEFAADLRTLADYLQRKAEFPMDYPIIRVYFIEQKEDFLSAVKSCGNGKKIMPTERYDQDLFYFIPGQPSKLTFQVMTYRSMVCRLVSPARAAEYDCDPILSQAQEE